MNLIIIKTEEQIQKVRESSKILIKTQTVLKDIIKPGRSLRELNDIAHRIIVGENAEPSFLGLYNFPKSICISVNNTLIHGIPTDYVLTDGDIISIDMGVFKNGYHADAAFTMGVGKISDIAKRLISATYEALEESIKIIKPGMTTGDIGYVTESIAKKHGFKVARDYSGHGIGASIHEEPNIPNFGTPNKGVKLKSGMIICIEPMLIAGSDKLFVDDFDKWSVKTVDNSLTAHAEHVVLVTDTSYEILTKERQ